VPAGINNKGGQMRFNENVKELLYSKYEIFTTVSVICVIIFSILWTVPGILEFSGKRLV
jgi:hypothetical protein